MKKIVITLLVTIALGTATFFATKSMSAQSLTPIQLANIEALTDPEGWGEVDFADACLPKGDGCAMKDGVWHNDDKPYYYSGKF